MSTITLDFSLTKPSIPSLNDRCRRRHHHHHHHHQWTGLKKTLLPPPPPLTPKHHHRRCRLTTLATSRSPPWSPPRFPLSTSTSVSAGRSKKKPGGPSPGRIEGNADARRRVKDGARKKGRRLAENLFYRHNNPHRNQADDFTDEELQMIGLGYDRWVRFMDKDDPNLRHPHDWYKYGQYGPYSWRGIVVGRPIRGRFSDERVTLIGQVRDHEEWEEIEQFEMSADFSARLRTMDSGLGFRHFWVFVRHPKWKSTELPFQQWTLVSEVVLEAGKQRLDKWNLMGRLGNKARALITQCAAWFRPDIIYVRRPVYQCRFEPQEDFFKLLGPLLDPSTEEQYMFELRDEEGRVELCTYFGGLCKIVRISEKAFVDDVVRAFQKLTDEGKSRCLDFLLTNHPMELLHPYTKEWKAKLEEIELGCDAPDESDEEKDREAEITDWIEEDEESEEEEEENTVIDLGGEDDGDEELGRNEEEVHCPEESKDYWDEQWGKALKSSEGMENLVKKSIEASNKFYRNQMMDEDQNRQMMMFEDRTPQTMENSGGGGDNVNETGRTNEPMEEELDSAGFRGLRRKIKRSKIPPELFLRAAVRPFTYRNLVKEIVLMRHAIVDQEIKVGID